MREARTPGPWAQSGGSGMGVSLIRHAGRVIFCLRGCCEKPIEFIFEHDMMRREDEAGPQFAVCSLVSTSRVDEAGGRSKAAMCGVRLNKSISRLGNEHRSSILAVDPSTYPLSP